MSFLLCDPFDDKVHAHTYHDQIDHPLHPSRAEKRYFGQYIRAENRADRAKNHDCDDLAGIEGYE
jgi:hypothetical protein